MKKMTFFIVLIAAALAFLYFSYPTYNGMLSASGNAVTSINKERASGIAVTASIAVIGLVGYLSTRNK